MDRDPLACSCPGDICSGKTRAAAEVPSRDGQASLQALAVFDGAHEAVRR